MKSLLLIISITIVFTSFTGCKKYPEDPNFITFRSVQKRLLGIWQINDFKIDGSSSTNLFDTTDLGNNVKIDKSLPEDSVDGDIVRIADVFGVWFFENYQKQLKFQFYDQNNDNNQYYYFGPFISGTTSIWDIQKLTMDELWLEINYESKNYKLFLKK